MPEKKPTIWLNNNSRQLFNIKPFCLGIPNNIDITTYKRLVNNPSIAEKYKELLELIKENLGIAADLYLHNRPFPDHLIPYFMYPIYDSYKNVTASPLFAVHGGYFIATQELIDILEQFTLGSNQICRINLYNTYNKKEASNYYFINICEHYEYCLKVYGDSSIIDAPYTTNNHKVYYAPHRKDDIKNYLFSQISLDCPVDIWHDPWIKGSIFISESLQKSISKAGLRKKISLFPCNLQFDY